MSQIEAMKLALEALETAESFDIDADDGYYLKAITALRQAIEQAQKQEPVAWLSKGGKGIWFHEPDASLNATPLYTSPPQRQWVGLTDEERKDLCRWWSSPMDAIYATEAKLKQNNQ